MPESIPQKAALEPYVLPRDFVKILEKYFEDSVTHQRRGGIREFKFTPNLTKYIADMAVLTFITTLPGRGEDDRNFQKIQKWVQFGTQSVTFPDNGASYLDVIDHQIFNQVADALLETLSFGKEQLNIVRQNNPKSVPSFYGSGKEERRKFEEVISHNLKVGSELLEDLRIVRKAVHMKLEKGYDQCSNDSVKNYMAAINATR
jgi:hypothetical protein